MAYAALVSVKNMIDHIPHSTHEKPQIISLKEKISYLQEFLEDDSQKSSKQIRNLESRITDAGYAAEDVIESHLLDQILVKSGHHWDKCSDDLEEVLEEFDSIKEKAMEIMDAEVTETQQLRSSSIPTGPSRSAPIFDNTMVGFDKHLIRIMDQIASHEANIQILPIVGMGGIGKTTLTRRVYDNQFIKEHFQIRLWITISQLYNVQEILLSFLHDLGVVDAQINLEYMSSMFLINNTRPESNNELGDKLYKTLSGRSYLIVMDDMWNVEVWDTIRRFFPNNCNGSRIIVTTRLLNVASNIGSCDPYKLEFLKKDESWNLLKEKVFGQDGCPSTLEAIGKKIAASCKGLPLAIVVIGGQLGKLDMTTESWEYFAEAINSAVNSDNDDYCLKILSLSYDNLPVHLKPCFLYMGVFPEDSEVRVSRLVKLWVAEGFLKPSKAEWQEDTAVAYLENLIERNLILVSKRGSSGKIKSCRIHDLLRDLCLREAHKQNFLCIRRFHSLHIPRGIEIKPHGKILRTIRDERYIPLILYPLRSSSLGFSSMKLLSELHVADVNSPEKNLLLISSRCLTVSPDYVTSSASLNSLSMLWNLQTLIMSEMPGNETIVLPPIIWEMHLLRHLEIQRVMLPDPPTAEADGNKKKQYVLESIQTLLNVHNFKFSEEVTRRIPNLKKMKITYRDDFKGVEWPLYCLDNLVRLHKLDSLSCLLYTEITSSQISFPRSLRKLTLDGGKIPWEDMTMVGSLPILEVLRLRNDAFYGREWRPIEGEFCQLKSLHLVKMSLEQWEADNFHFPRLESLIIYEIHKMKEIPLSIGDIPTLQLISLEHCSISLVNSARLLREEQESMGNIGIQIHAT